MALTPAEQSEFQRLGTSLGFFNNPVETPDPSAYGMLGFSGRTAANILPGALEKIVQPVQAILGMDERSSIPNFFDVRAPQNIPEHIIGGAGELAEYLPSILLTEGVGAASLARLGMAPRAAKIAGAGLGFGLPMAPEGAETAAMQGGVGALQTAAMDWGWRGKVAAGLLGGAAGYYEGAKGPDGSPEKGALFGALNVLGPTVIDPVVNRLTGYKPMQDIGGGRPIEGQPAPKPSSPLPGAAGVMDDAFQQMNPAQKQAYLDAVAGRSGPADNPSVGLSGTFRRPNTLFPDVSQPAPGGINWTNEIGLPVGPDVPYGPNSGAPYDVFAGLQKAPTVGPTDILTPTERAAGRTPAIFPRRTGLGIDPISDLPGASVYGAGREYDVFAGLQQPPIITHNELFPVQPPTPRVFESRSRMSETAVSGPDIYGGQMDAYDAFGNVPRRELSGALTPGETQARATFETQRAAARPTAESLHPSSSGRKSRAKEPHTKIPSGLQKLLTDDVGWTAPGTPLKEGFTRDAFNLGRKLKTQKDIDRANKMAAEYDKAWARVMDNATSEDDLMRAQELANRKQYFTEAAEYASGNPAKAATFRRHDPNYAPNVPHPKWTAMVESGLDAPPPSVGDQIVHWTDEGFPLDTNVTRVEGNIVHYTENNFITGEKSEKVASLQEFDRLQKHPQDRAAVEAANKQVEPSEENPVRKKLGGTDRTDLTQEEHTELLRRGKGEPPKKEPGESPATAPAVTDGRPQVMVQGRFGPERATVISREGNTLQVQIEDPIFGARTTSVLESDTRPVASLQPETPKGGTVPFQDVDSIKLRGTEGGKGSAWAGEDQVPLLGSMMEGSGPGTTKKTLAGKTRDVLTLEEGLKRLPPEAGAIIGSIIERMKFAAGKDIDTSMALRLVGAKGAMYETSGRVALNLQWLNGVVQHWPSMSEATQAKALMRIAALFGHEVSHVAHKFAERSNLLVDGVPITTAVMQKVESMSQVQRDHVAREILRAKGEVAPSKAVVAYLSGDLDQVYGWYKRQRPNLTREQAKELAAGEVLAEIGSVELIGRTKVDGLPQKFREAVDMFKNVLVRIIDYFRGTKELDAVAGLQDLRKIAGHMYDHLASGDTAMLGKAFPASTAWKPAPIPNPFSSGTLPPSPTNTPPIQIHNAGLLKADLARLGVRATVGGVAGGILGPQVGPNQISTAEGVMLGGILGVFGPAVAKRLLTKDFPQEVKAAIAANKGNPVKTLAAIMGGGKSLRELGAEARFGLTAESSAAAKFVRILESQFNLNLDPKMKALLEEGRGLGTLILATVQDALDKVRWYKPSPTMLDAVDNYFTGKISKDQFEQLLTTPELQNYGRFIVTAREGMTTLTNMFASGMRKSQFRDHLIETSDKYLGRFYSAYKEGKFNMEAFGKAKQDFMARYPEYSDFTADSIMREYMREVQANRSVFRIRRGNSGQKIDSSTTYRRLATEEEIEAQAVLVGGLEHNPFTPEYQKEKAKLDWMMEHKVTDNWREWLGEYKNPVERMVYTFQKVYPSAISAKIFDLLDNRINSNGLKFAYTSKELVTLRQMLEHGTQSVTDPTELARLQNQIRELDAYGAVPEGSAYGKLSGKWVDRWTRDELNTYSTPFKWMEQPILRSIAEFNNLIKVGRTAFNPLTTIRNYLQMPAFALIARTTAGDVAEAYRQIHKVKGDDYRLMLQRHIIGADYVASELSNGPSAIFSGYMDSDIAVKAAKYGADKILKFYQQPDQLVRAGAFISARKRFAQRAMESGEFASLQDAMHSPKVIDDAVNFTERYTMNYGTVPNIIKVGRQLPFVNLFISYTAEITRILKNLTEDAISPGPNSAGRMHAITALGAMAAIPAVMTAWAKSNLSDKDRADWEKLEKLSPDYNRARFRIPTGRDEQGRFKYFDITNMLPADNYSQMIKALSNGDFQAAAAANPILSLQNTPLLNMAAEQIAGEDLRTSQKIEGLGRVREVLKETLPPWVPPGFEGQRLVKAFSPNDQGGRGLTNIKSGAQYSPSDIVANYMTGMRFGTADLATVQRAAISEAKQEIAIQQQLMRDTTNLNVPPEQRAKAQAIYNEAVTQIMLRLHSKMGQPADAQR